MTETLRIAELIFQIQRSERRATVSLTVSRDGSLLIHAPKTSDVYALEQWVRSKLMWVQRKLAHKQQYHAARKPEFVTGESFSYLGRLFRLRTVIEQDQPLRFDGTHFLLRYDSKQAAEDHFRRWYVAVGRDWISNRVNLLARKVGALPRRVEIRDLGYRWGSCGRSGVTFFNWRLLQFSVRVLDYVIVHELVHLLEPNHSRGFWSILERAMPDWREREGELSKNDTGIYWCGVPVRKRELFSPIIGA